MRKIYMDVFSKSTDSFWEAAYEVDFDINLYEWYLNIRFPKGFDCPHCGNRKRPIYNIEEGKRFKCGKCSKKFSVYTGTIFENTKRNSLVYWLSAMSIYAAHPEVSSAFLARELNWHQPVAWKVLKKLKKAHVKGGVYNITVK